MNFSRRRFGSFLFGALLDQCIHSEPAKAEPKAFEVDRLLGEHPYDPVSDHYRLYRADAVVSVFSVPVFARAGVGSGFASIREARRAGFKITTCRFGGGSLPARAHNLNRLGIIEEVVVERDGCPLEAAYFGFMTYSPEEGVAEAGRSLKQTPGSVSYVASEGSLLPARFRCATARFSFPARLTWSDRVSLLHQVRSQFHESPADTRCRDLSGTPWPGTFLYRIASAVRQHARTFDEHYVYNGKQFRVTLDKAMDPKTAAAFASKGLTQRPEAVAVFHGAIHKEAGSKVTRFRLWIEEDGPTLLPLRIELQARSFLSLAFEFDPNLQSGKERREL